MKTSLTFLFLILLNFSLNAQTLSRAEKKMVEYLSENEQAEIDLIEKSVNINSGTLNLKGVKEVGMLYKSELDALGFTTRWITMPDSLNRAGHLFAEINGGTGQTLLLIGHLDTVFEEDHEFQKFKKSDSIAYGPAVNDMKGGNVFITFALKALHPAGELKNKNIIVALTGDAQKPGSPLNISLHDLIEAAKKSDIALGFDT